MTSPTSHWSSKILSVAARNVFWNYCGTATAIALGFVVTPALVARLGHTDYGIWILLGSVASYFNLIDLGLRGSVGRAIAVHRATHDGDEIRRAFSSAFVVLGGIGLVSLACIMILQAGFFALFEVPQQSADSARVAFLLVGLNLAISFPLKVFDGTLWAYERFDLINWVDIPTHILRASLTLWLVEPGHGLVVLAWITLSLTVVPASVKAVCCWRQDPALRILPRQLSKDVVRSLFNFGIWGFLMQGARQTRTQAGPIIVGAALGVPAVTPFALARRLQDYAQTFVVTGTGVFTPIATRMHAIEDVDGQRALFLTGSRVCSAIAFGFLGLYLCFAAPFLRLWIGPDMEHAAVYLWVLATGEALAMSQSITANMMLSKARHQPLAWFAIIETTLSILLALALVVPFGAIGICAGLALPQVAFGGAATISHGCGVIGVSVREYLKATIASVLARASAPVALVWLAVDQLPPHNWLTLVGWVVVYGGTYAAAVGTLIVPRRHLVRLLGWRVSAGR